MASSPRPTTPIRVPKAAGSYAPSIVDPGLRSEINTLLLQGGHVVKIQETLLHALQLSPTNWPSLIQTHAINLLRSGTCHTFPELLAQVMEDIKADTLTQAAAQQANSQQPSTTSQSPSAAQDSAGGKSGGGGKGRQPLPGLPGLKLNGLTKETNGKEAAVVTKGRGEDGQSLALPMAVVEEGLRVTRECLEVVCEFQP